MAEAAEMEHRVVIRWRHGRQVALNPHVSHGDFCRCARAAHRFEHERVGRHVCRCALPPGALRASVGAIVHPDEGPAAAPQPKRRTVST
eukprot:7221509-Prymnesium_polylepis.1